MYGKLSAYLFLSMYMYHFIGADNVVAVVAEVASAAIQMAIDDRSVDIDKLARVGYESIIDQIPNEIPSMFGDITAVVWSSMCYIFWSE